MLNLTEAEPVQSHIVLETIGSPIVYLERAGEHTKSAGIEEILALINILFTTRWGRVFLLLGLATEIILQ